jgi:hypothetical protein
MLKHLIIKKHFSNDCYKQSKIGIIKQIIGNVHLSPQMYDCGDGVGFALYEYLTKHTK